MQQQIALEACWALSNLAAQEYKFSQHVIEAGPVFIAHLSGGFGVAIAEQSAWAIGALLNLFCTDTQVLLFLRSGHGSVNKLKDEMASEHCKLGFAHYMHFDWCTYC